jgi:hypothetical protein
MEGWRDGSHETRMVSARREALGGVNARWQRWQASAKSEVD